MKKSGYYDVLHVPYVAGFSEKLAKDLKHVNVGVTFQKGKTIFNSVCKLKPPKHSDERKNVIYCLGCNSCNQRYLGETQQFFPSRRYQHEYAIRCKQKTNGIAQHILKNKKHTIDWENRVFLDFEPHWRKRKIKEALFIDCLNPGVTMMPHMLMNLEKELKLPVVGRSSTHTSGKYFPRNIHEEKPTEKKMLELLRENTHLSSCMVHC